MRPVPEVDAAGVVEAIARLGDEQRVADKAARRVRKRAQRAREQREAGLAANARTYQAIENDRALIRAKATAWAREQLAAERAGTVELGDIYVDVPALLAGDLKPRTPDAGAVRSDGERMLYRGATNAISGLPETGKGLVATANAVDELRLGSGNGEGRVLWIDADENGGQAIAEKLLAGGAGADVLGDRSRFRIVVASNPDEILAAIADAAQWQPTLVVVDSITRLIGMLGGNPNVDVDYLAAHNAFLAPLRALGAAVLAIDHDAKTASSDSDFASGTGQKKAALDGVFYRVKVIEQFKPGEGGRSALTILKDRHGGVRATTPGKTAAVFALDSRDGEFTWEFWRGHDDGAVDTGDEDVAFVLALDDFPSSRRALQAITQAKADDGRGWGSARAAKALSAARASRNLGGTPLDI